MNETNDFLTPESVMMVEGVLYGDWIPCLKGYGPFRRCSIKVKDIVNLLNNDIKVVLRDEQIEKLFYFVKQYNEMLKITNSSEPKALRAEEILYQRVYGKSLEIEREENKNNPFIDEDEESISIAAETIANKSNATSETMINPLSNLKNNKIKRVHAYDIFNSSNNDDSPIKKMDEINDILKYGNVDFDVS